MSYKNSLKVLSSNFNYVWKQLAYSLICGAIVLGLSSLLAMPTIELLKSQGWVDSLSGIVKAVYMSPEDLISALKNIIVCFFDILSGAFSTHWFSYVGFGITAVLLPTFLMGLGRFTICFIAMNKTSSLTEVGFTNSLFSNLGSALAYSSVKMLFDIVFFAFSGLIFCLYLKLADSVLLALILGFVFLTLLVGLEAFKLSLFSNFAPLMIEENKRTGKAFKLSLKCAFKSFGRTFSNCVIVVITIIAVNMFFGIFTIGVGLILTIPTSQVFVGIFMDINYYTTHGKRYYLSENLIAEPKIKNQKI